jgi:transcription elongation factor GreA
MDKPQEYLTKSKFDEFAKELEHLKTVRRKEIAQALEYASSLGDKSENAEYHEARDAQAYVEDRINHLEALLKTASIVSKHDTSTIGVGSVMILERDGSKEKKEYTIVGSEESDAAKGLISMRSPLGIAALGKTKGETFSFKSPAGAVNYKIIDIK